VGLLERLFGRPARHLPPAQSTHAGPTLLCSACLTPCCGAAAHVIPWWNTTAGDFFTAYRCDGCWLASLSETGDRVQVWDENVRSKFCAFLDRHLLRDIAQQVRDTSLPEASRLALVFLDILREGRHRLLP
jgi:hypothetical protein